MKYHVSVGDVLAEIVTGGELRVCLEAVPDDVTIFLFGEVARRLLDRFPITAVRVQVRKETPVLDGIVDWVGVDIERRQGDEIPRRGEDG